MARVLVSAFSNVTWTKERHHDSFVEGFTRALERCGNEVLLVMVNGFIHHPMSPILAPNINKSELIEDITEFNPELIITFNNSFPCEEFITITNCPIILYTADGCDFFAFKELINKHLDRYVFLNLNDSVYYSLKANYPFIKEEQYCDFGYATDFRALKLEQDLNISFLGSIPNYTYDLVRYFMVQDSNEIKNTYFKEFERFKNNVFDEFKCKLPDFNSDAPLETLAIFLLTAKERFKILSELTELDLTIYGYNSFCLAGVYDYEILKAFNFDLCVSIAQSETLFNRSKISLNLPNARATCGFSWRVPDILATNSVLLSPDKRDLKRLFEGYIDLPTFNSPSEAKYLAIKLLKDNKWRKEISTASQQMIDDKCRFELKFKTMKEHTQIDLFPNSIGIVHNLNSDKYIYSGEKKVNKRYKVLRETSKILPYFIARKILQKVGY